MEANVINPSNRREFLRTCFRVPAVALLAGIGVTLVARKTFSKGEACVINQFCRNCSLFPDCEKPQAQHTRKAS